jgi:hypothetical protein
MLEEWSEDVIGEASLSLQKLLTLSALTRAASEARQFDWDNEGSAAVSLASLGHAWRFVLVLPNSVEPPDVAVDPDGEVSFDWHYGPRNVVSVSVAADGSLAYAALIGSSRSHGTEIFGENIPGTIASLIDRVVASASAR